MALPDPLPIEPTTGFDARVRPPGSKSLTNRALLLAALATGRSELRGVLLADDTRVMIEGLRQLGFELEVDEAAAAVSVDGSGARIPAATADVSLGNAGTAMRFLAAACCLGPGPYGLDGVARMRQRPIDQLVDPLRELGAEIDYVGQAGCPPLRVRGAGFAGGSVSLGLTLSSQYISALLQVGPCCPDGIELQFTGPITSFPYVAMTLGLMRRFGANVILAEDWSRVRVESGGYRACGCSIEPDASNASYFLAAAAISPSSRCVVEGLGTESLQGDADFARVLESMGARVQRRADEIVVVGPDRLRGIDVDLNRMPDMAQTLAVVALFARGPTAIRGIGNLRVKETDRLAALESELAKLGATVRVDGDDLHVEMATPGELRPADIRTYDDHRMAMSFAVAGLQSDGIRIQDPTCVNKTFPGFWDHLRDLGPIRGADEMNRFWHFASKMLRYKRLLILGAAGALFDALCAFSGFSALMSIIDQMFNHQVPMQELIRQKLADPRVASVLGDVTWIANGIPAEPVWGFATVLGFILCLTFLGASGRFLHQYCMFTVSLRTVTLIRKQAFQHLVHLPMAVVAREGTADHLSRVVRDCNQLSRGFHALTAKAARDLLQGLAMLSLAFLLDWKLSAVFLIGVPLIVVCVRKFGKVVRRAAHRVLGEYGHMVRAIQESLQAMRVVKVNQAEGYERRRFNTINRRVLSQEMTARTARALASPVIEILAVIAVMVVCVLAASLVFSGAREPGDLVKVLLMLGVAGMAFRPLGNLNNSLQEAAAAADRVAEVMDLEVEPSVRAGGDRGARLPRHANSVTFEEVCFHYPGTDQPVLREINLQVPHGTHCAIVGGNGSGKSTLLGLLPRLYHPTSGRVLIDGVDIATVSLRSLRRQIAMVTQETVLFDGTIADNIRYGSRHVTREQVIEAARQAHAHEFIMEQPQGYDTQVGEQGMRLSGGQRQRMAIARAILRRPALLILDEATSQIDSDSEAQINDALARFTQNLTTFVIAHRLSTVIDADLIAVLDNGALAATGQHADLLETSPVYRLLCQTQLNLALDQATSSK